MTLGFQSAQLAACRLCESRGVVCGNFRHLAQVRCTGCALMLQRNHAPNTESGIAAVVAAWNRCGAGQIAPVLTAAIEEGNDPAMLRKRIADLEDELIRARI